MTDITSKLKNWSIERLNKCNRRVRVRVDSSLQGGRTCDERTSSGLRLLKHDEVRLWTYLFLYFGDRLITYRERREERSMEKGKESRRWDEGSEQKGGKVRGWVWTIEEMNVEKNDLKGDIENKEIAREEVTTKEYDRTENICIFSGQRRFSEDWKQ